MHDTHIDQLSHSQGRCSQCLTGQNLENKEQSKIQHETPCGKNHKATQSKNNTRTKNGQ